MERVNDKNAESMDNLNQFMSTSMKQINGGPEFCRAKLEDIKACLAEFGSPTWFVTLSPAEYWLVKFENEML